MSKQDVLEIEFNNEETGKVFQESDPFLTRTTSRPTSTPTITSRPTQPTFSPSTGPTRIPTPPPSRYPTISSLPTSSEFPSFSSNPTSTPTPTLKESTYLPGFTPSAYPSKKIDNNNENGGCPLTERLYEVILFDSFGDGWDNRELLIERLGDDLYTERVETEAISSSQVTVTRVRLYGNGITTASYEIVGEAVKETQLPSVEVSQNPIFMDTLFGETSIGYACLQPGRCYRATISGGGWSNEISWEIQRSELFSASNTVYRNDTIVDGGAPSNCTFQVPGDIGDFPKMFCPFDCHISGKDPLGTTEPSSAPVTPMPTFAPITPAPSFAPITIAPTQVPTLSPSPNVSPSRNTTFINSDNPTNSTGRESYANSTMISQSNTSNSASDTSVSPWPSILLSSMPSGIPSDVPSALPSDSPSKVFSESPTTWPTRIPSVVPTIIPSSSPSLSPTKDPIYVPTFEPSISPTQYPSEWIEAYKAEGKVTDRHTDADLPKKVIHMRH
jgi:hypothetical protein